MGFFKGSYHPIPMGRLEFGSSPDMKTVLIMLWIMILLLSTGKAVIMYTGFCVLKVLLKMRKRGFYGSALINKR